MPKDVPGSPRHPAGPPTTVWPEPAVLGPQEGAPFCSEGSRPAGLHHTLHSASSQGRLCPWTIQKAPEGPTPRTGDPGEGSYPVPGLDQGSTLCARGTRKPVGPSPRCRFHGNGSFPNGEERGARQMEVSVSPQEPSAWGWRSCFLPHPSWRWSRMAGPPQALRSWAAWASPELPCVLPVALGCWTERPLSSSHLSALSWPGPCVTS